MPSRHLPFASARTRLVVGIARALPMICTLGPHFAGVYASPSASWAAVLARVFAARLSAAHNATAAQQARA